MTTQQLIEEGLEEYMELMKVDQSNIQVVELLDKPQVEIRIPFLEDWLTTYSAKLVEAAREEELNRQTQNMDAVIAGMLQAARKEERERIVAEYGYMNDGCGCCMNETLEDALTSTDK